MSKKVHLSYACPVSWDQMLTTGEKERHCQMCQKHIRDFTKDDEPDVSGVECGRFALHQVGSISGKFQLGAGTLAAFSLAALLGITPGQSFAQATDTIQNEIFKGSYNLYGTLSDKETGQTLPFANVLVREPNGPLINGTTTDHEGNFSLRLYGDQLNKGNLIVEVTYIGYEKMVLSSLEFDPDKRTKILEVKMEMSDEPLEQVDIIYVTTGLIDKRTPDTENDSTHTGK
ncbi:MAG: carboxypeptidase-like regulatory domain-containing protein [Owenweeksia sp.]